MSEKVGLITADEVVAAGGRYYSSPNEKFYLYKGNAYWSFSPSYLYSNNISGLFIVNSNGEVFHSFTTSSNGIAPVISLTSEYVSTLEGLGTMESHMRHNKRLLNTNNLFSFLKYTIQLQQSNY